jgi:transglutaminase-like putative cysteine protease
VQLRIVHSTGFTYDGTASASYNQARLTPLTTPEQIVVHHRLEIAPKPWTYDYRDYFGNQVTAFEVSEPHEALTVTAISTVQVGRPGVLAPALGWAEMAGREVSDRWTEYLMLPDLVAPPEELAVEAAQLAADAALPGEAATRVSALVRDRVAHKPGFTDIGTTAAEAWAQGTGAGQDLVHLTLGALRHIGIPCRYVSGYFHPSASPEVGETVEGESHAWVEWWDDGWRPYDPTTCAPPGDTYVALATGRDYTDVTPLRGIYSGGATSTMNVSVTVTRLA